MVKGGKGHATVLCGLSQGNLSVPPIFTLLLESLGEAFLGAAEAYPTLLGGGNAFCLSLTDAHTLVLRYEGEDLENDVAEEGSHEVFPTSCVEERHVKNHDIRALLLGDVAPFAENLGIVSAQPVNGMDVKQGIFVDTFQHPLILRAVKVLA